MVLDCLTWVFVLTVLTVARYDLTFSDMNRPGLVVAIALAVAGQLAGFCFMRQRFRYASTDEIVALALLTGAITVALVLAAALTAPRIIPLSVALAAPASALLTMVGARWVFVRVRRSLQAPRPNVQRTLVLGAGAGGTQAISMMLNDAHSALRPVGILDDHPGKQHLRVSGVRVLGRINELPEVATRTQAQVAVFAIPSATAEQVAHAADLAASAGLELKVLPSSTEILATHKPGPRRQGQVRLHTSVFRSLSLEDLLGRRAIDTDIDSIAGYLEGRVVVVTGAGGSIGSQLCREIAQYSPARLVMTDRDESSLHAVQLSIDGQAMLDSDDLVLGDLRSPGFIDRLLEAVRPDIVFHAAALKHLTLTERFPEEAFLTNVAATKRLLVASAQNGVKRFVHISTDKAADPESVLGYTKRISERLTATVGQALPPDHRYISVRFGNVLGSRGSALTAFAAQLEAGLPLTITSPDMTRYFMSAQEACQLVLQAGAIGRSGEVLVLDMGEPHNVEELARRFAALQGYPDPEVVYTHPRPGEKIVETRLGQSESDHRPVHPLITHVTAPLVDRRYFPHIANLRDEVRSHPPTGAIVEWLREAALGSGEAPVLRDLDELHKGELPEGSHTVRERAESNR
ncbi:polysaccharide biosynthesis protein [Georgenia sp. AZ-5]|uniref:polysaccharide biosynthesis protein n=1 Tax=Georgenia sp. AZ-5 TaxID=3367526 RepID=UPI003754987F